MSLQSEREVTFLWVQPLLLVK